MRIRTLGLAAAALGLASATYQAYGERRDARRFPPPGQLVDVGGRRLHLWCEGAGTPTVVILPALGTPALEWVGVQRALKDDTTVCLVDRAGVGWSDPGPWPRTFGRMADEFQTVLEVARVPTPYVLVGHSIGGLIARLYCARNRARVAGLVLVDSTPEDLASLQRAGAARFYWRALQCRARPLGLVRARVELGLSRSHREYAKRVCPPDLEDAYVAIALKSSGRRADVQELLNIAATAEVSREARRLGRLPVTVITAGPRGRESWYAGWRELQDDLASLSECTTRVFAEHAGHHVHHDDQELVVRAIRDLVRSCSTRASADTNAQTTSRRRKPH